MDGRRVDWQGLVSCSEFVMIRPREQTLASGGRIRRKVIKRRKTEVTGRGERGRRLG